MIKHNKTEANRLTKQKHINEKSFNFTHTEKNKVRTRTPNLRVQGQPHYS